jgi:hypothetical protein
MQHEHERSCVNVLERSHNTRDYWSHLNIKIKESFPHPHAFAWCGSEVQAHNQYSSLRSVSLIFEVIIASGVYESEIHGAYRSWTTTVVLTKRRSAAWRIIVDMDKSPLFTPFCENCNKGLALAFGEKNARPTHGPTSVRTNPGDQTSLET